MTIQEAKDQLAAICANIVQQNRELIAGLDEPDFDPGIRLDNTKNNAGYKLTDFFDTLKAFPYGSVPCEVTNELVATTDELVEKIRKKYSAFPAVVGEAIRAGQAFRNSKRIWRIKNPIRIISQELYELRLDEALANILRALDDLNYELCVMSAQSAQAEDCGERVLKVEVVKPAKPKKPVRAHPKQTPFMLEQVRVFKAYLDKNPVCASYSIIDRARQCWHLHKAEWDRAAKNKVGYASYKNLARGV